jgi:DNA-binding XRE family transcriptional regulator
MAAKPRNRLGRKPGKWTLLTAQDLRDYRANHKLSRDRLAVILGVSRTSVQNWETLELPPSMKTQEKLAQLIAGGPTAIPPPTKPPSLWDRPRPEGTDAGVITATGLIVAAWAKTHAKITPEELLELIKTVRATLTS